MDFQDTIRDTTTEYDPRKKNRNKQEAVEFVQNLLKEVEEEEAKTEMPPSTDISIELDILHKGQSDCWNFR